MIKLTRAAAVGSVAAGLIASAFLVPQAIAGTPAEGETAAAAPGAAPSGQARHSGVRSLGALGLDSGVRIGTAVNMDVLGTEAAYTEKVAGEFNSVTPENVMKWEVVEPARGEFNFAEADRLVNFAKANKQLVRGHTLVWHNQLPAWVTQGDFSAQELRDILREHITAEVSHFKGKIWQWDVVNEVFNEDGTYRDSIFLQKLGPGYIADAFRWARQADPKAKLYINDYNVDGINAKSTATYNLVAQLRKQGVPIDGFGIQGHLDTQYPAPHDIADNLARFDKLGVDSAITEADVRIPLPADNTEIEAQNQAYSTLLTGCLLAERCTDFTVWGFTDKYSWVPGVFEGEGQANIFDENYQPKSAYTVLSQLLRVAGH